MMLHLGGGDMVPTRHIVAILDLQTAIGPDAAAFLKDHPMPPGARTAIITHAYGKTSVRPSTISSLTLLRRGQADRATGGGQTHPEGGRP